MITKIAIGGFVVLVMALAWLVFCGGHSNEPIAPFFGFHFCLEVDQGQALASEQITATVADINRQLPIKTTAKWEPSQVSEAARYAAMAFRAPHEDYSLR